MTDNDRFGVLVETMHRTAEHWIEYRIQLAMHERDLHRAQRDVAAATHANAGVRFDIVRRVEEQTEIVNDSRTRIGQFFGLIAELDRRLRSALNEPD